MKILGLSKKEVFLVVALIVLLVAFGIYKLVYQPQMTKIAELTAELERTNKEREEAEVKIAAIPRLESEVAAAEELVMEETPPFFSGITQENLIVLLADTAAQTSFGAASYSFSEPTVSKIEAVGSKKTILHYYLKDLVDNYLLKYATEEQKEDMLETLEALAQEKEESSAEPEKIAEGSDDLEKVSVGITFDSTYFQLIAYLQALEGYHKKIVVNSLAINGRDGATLNGAMVLDFYKLPRIFLDDADWEELEWQQEIPKGKDNPFNFSDTIDDDGGVILPDFDESIDPAADTGIISDRLAYRNSDFFMIARSSTADMPTLVVGAVSDSSYYITETFEGMKTVTAQFTEENGKYYYSYSTDTAEFPSEDKEEFVPVKPGILNFIIYSGERLSERDTNIVNVRINNNTGLRLNVEVDGDDKDRPRIRVV